MTDNPRPNTLQEAELLDELLAAVKIGDLSRRDAILGTYPQLQEWLDCLNVLNRFTAPDPEATVVPGRGELPRVSLDSGLFGRYELFEEVGRGGMGVVYRARHRELNRQVALKMILASELASPEEIRRFQAEARTVARLHHPNIVAVHDVDEHLGRHFFAMDFVEGESLAAVLSRSRVSAEQAARWLVTIAGAVQHLHEQGIIHRDLKPSNILIDGRGEPVVTDFGLAKIFDGDSQSTRTGAILGTPSYMSPEQASGRISLISPRSDVYSLGAMLYELLTGMPPFRGETALDTLVQVLESEPKLPRRIVKHLPRSIELICLKCLEKDPGLRYNSADELAKDLTRFLDGEPVEALPGGPIQQLNRWIRRQPGLACHVLALATALLIVQVYFAFSEISLDYHLRMTGVLVVWVFCSLIWQPFLRRERFADAARIGTVLSDVGFLTTALALSNGPIGQMLVVYSVLISASGLWFRTRLVWFTTAAAVAGYLLLCVLNPSLREPWHYPLLVATSLCIVGAATAYQVHRVRALSRFYDRRPQA